jgi:diguanylate cyclase (GGDEF)-like protein
LLVDAFEGPIQDAERQALKAIADYSAIAIENARAFQKVHELAVRDEHTGLYNARHLRNVLENEIERATRFQHHVSLLFLDIDHFKSVNDAHGHLAGSALLKEAGELLSASIRKVEHAFRYGGDEFAVVLVETPKNGALVAGQRLRERFHRTKFLHSHGLEVPATVSIGVASFPDDAPTATALLHAADRAMYRAKSLGRNRVA